MEILLAVMCSGGLFYSVFFGDTDVIAEAAARSAGDAVSLWMTVAAAMMFWSGLMRVADKAGLVDKVCRGVRPVLGRLMPDVPRDSPAMRAAALNVTSNLLGLGNAALPFGISAMKRLTGSGCSRRTLAVFVLLNTASIQLIPMNIIMLRTSAGSTSPSDCVLPILVNSLAALICGLLMTMLLYGGERNGTVHGVGAAADSDSADGRSL
ncbi:spore maturation protein A [Ruminococcaceae bacterium FB2012]|nr:spore maturation protein A [Ruminococcaceae bacterium FB2012]